MSDQFIPTESDTKFFVTLLCGLCFFIGMAVGAITVGIVYGVLA